MLIGSQTYVTVKGGLQYQTYVTVSAFTVSNVCDCQSQTYVTVSCFQKRGAR